MIILVNPQLKMTKRSKSIAASWKENPNEGLPTAYELASLAAQIMRAVPERELASDLQDFIEVAWDLHYYAKCRISELVHRRIGS